MNAAGGVVPVCVVYFGVHVGDIDYLPLHTVAQVYAVVDGVIKHGRYNLEHRCISDEYRRDRILKRDTDGDILLETLKPVAGPQGLCVMFTVRPLDPERAARTKAAVLGVLCDQRPGGDT